MRAIKLPIQRVKSAYVGVNPNISLFTEMEEVCEAHGGLGLAAIQVDCPVRQAIIKYSCHFDYVSPLGYIWMCDTSYYPREISQLTQIVESCLSLPGKRYLVHRFDSYVVRGNFFNFRTQTLVDKSFIVNKPTPFQHEIDHFNNVLISDIGIFISAKGVTHEH